MIWGHSYIDRKAFLCQCSRTGWFKVPCSHRVIQIAQSKLSKLYTFSARVHFAATKVSGSFHDSHQRSLRFAQPRQSSCKTVSPTDVDALGVGSVQVHSVGGHKLVDKGPSTLGIEAISFPFCEADFPVLLWRLPFGAATKVSVTIFVNAPEREVHWACGKDLQDIDQLVLRTVRLSGGLRCVCSQANPGRNPR